MSPVGSGSFRKEIGRRTGGMSLVYTKPNWRHLLTKGRLAAAPFIWRVGTAPAVNNCLTARRTCL